VLIGYARVSTLDQNLDLQTDALDKAGCERIFSETVSGARTERAALSEALSHARAGDVFVVWKLDRLGRTVGQLVDFVSGLRARGVEFRSLTDGIDTTTPAGRFFFHMMAALAEMERDLIRERTMAGLVAARARGRRGGRKLALSGRQIAQARLLLNHPDQTMEGIASSLGVSRSTLYRALARDGAEPRTQ
jgi:DNA invertase Pin-like site-specific DNA recombinase